MLAKVIQESRAECGKALRYLAEIRLAFPEVLQAIKSKQLAQEILLYKEDQIGMLARTGEHAAMCRLVLLVLLHGFGLLIQASSLDFSMGSSSECCSEPSGLLEDSEVTQMESLLERKLKHIYFFPPYIAGALPAKALQQLDLFSDVPAGDFRSQVCIPCHTHPALNAQLQLAVLSITNSVAFLVHHMVWPTLWMAQAAPSALHPY